VVGAAFALSAAAQTTSGPTASLPYETLAGQLRIFQNIPQQQRDHVVAGVAIRHAGSKIYLPVKLWVIDGTQRIDIPLSADGIFFGPIHEDWIARHLVVQTDQPKHTLNLGAGLWIAIPAQRPISLAYLQEGMRQTNAVIAVVARAAGGYFAQLAAPRMHHLTMTLEGCCTGTATLNLAGATTVLHQDSNGDIPLPDAALADGAQGSVMPSATVTKLDPQ
jgi:hypothetical protein